MVQVDGGYLGGEGKNLAVTRNLYSVMLIRYLDLNGDSHLLISSFAVELAFLGTRSALYQPGQL